MLVLSVNPDPQTRKQLCDVLILSPPPAGLERVAELQLPGRVLRQGKQQLPVLSITLPPPAQVTFGTCSLFFQLSHGPSSVEEIEMGKWTRPPPGAGWTDVDWRR